MSTSKSFSFLNFYPVYLQVFFPCPATSKTIKTEASSTELLIQMWYIVSICSRSPGLCTKLGKSTWACSNAHAQQYLGKVSSPDKGCSQPCPESESSSVLSALLIHRGYKFYLVLRPSIALVAGRPWTRILTHFSLSGASIPWVFPAGMLTQFYQKQLSKPNLSHQKIIAKR